MSNIYQYKKKYIKLGIGLFRWRYNDCHNIMFRERRMKGTKEEDSERGQQQLARAGDKKGVV